VNDVPEPGPAAPQQPLPSGTVTFVFTDIEGSTVRWERDRDAMQDAVRRHDALMRAVIGDQSGYVFKTIGDAFCAAFARPEDAIAATLRAQRALAGADFSAVAGIRVRAAVHTGTADERDGDYFGPTVNRVARLLAIGHGGQVILSGTTAGLVRDALPPQTSLRDLGEHRLKDLARPERVYQLVAEDLPTHFPPLRSLDARANNLPAALTSFVGRESEVEELAELLAAHRVVTLVGSGGIGKTRLSLQTAANLLDGFRDGVWFVELAPLASGAYIPTAVAQALGRTLPAEGDPVSNLVRAIEDSAALLVFDNCEHLVEAAGTVISALVRGCARLKVLASSRQSLRISGEAIFRLQSLSFPSLEKSATLTAVAASRFASTELFVQRAVASDRRFVLTDANAPAIAEICRRLDGIPLALELAAARVKILNPQQLCERLEARFRLLAGGNRDLLPRQQTLRALIDWSHDLLDDRERALFRRLGIFPNGFALDAAVAVASGGDLDELDAIDVLASLVDKSLVMAEPAGDAQRYRLLESTRAYANEKLAEAGEGDDIANRHFSYFRDVYLAAQATADPAFHDALRSDLEDVRAALSWATRGPDASAGADLLDAIWAGMGVIGLYAEGLSWVETYLRILPHDAWRARARLSLVAAILLANSGRMADAFAAAERSVGAARASGDSETLASALAMYSWNAARVGQSEIADAAIAEAFRMPEAETKTRLRLLEVRALLNGQRGDLDSAVRDLEELREYFRCAGIGRSERVMGANIAEMEHKLGRTQRSIEIVREMISRFASDPDRNAYSQMLGNLAGYLTAIGDGVGAIEAARDAIGELAVADPGSPFVAVAMEHMALAFALLNDFARAAVLAGYAGATFERHGYEREHTELTTHARLNRLVNAALGPDEFTRLRAKGAALDPSAAVAYALAATVR
jgi:predicted ATPase/class 3 adenylate cyclase